METEARRKMAPKAKKSFYKNKLKEFERSNVLLRMRVSVFKIFELFGE